MRPHLKACVPSIFKGITTTSDPSLRLSLMGQARGKLGGVVDGP